MVCISHYIDVICICPDLLITSFFSLADSSIFAGAILLSTDESASSWRSSLLIVSNVDGVWFSFTLLLDLSTLIFVRFARFCGIPNSYHCVPQSYSHYRIRFGGRQWTAHRILYWIPNVFGCRMKPVWRFPIIIFFTRSFWFTPEHRPPLSVSISLGVRLVDSIVYLLSISHHFALWFHLVELSSLLV